MLEWIDRKLNPEKYKRIDKMTEALVLVIAEAIEQGSEKSAIPKGKRSGDTKQITSSMLRRGGRL